jgi:hypothetical protein
MPQTYAEVWRSVKLHASAAPTFLVRDWVNDAWKTLCRKRPTANFLRASSALTINAARSVACTVTLGSATVTSVGLFLPADVGRAFRVTTYPYYTVIAQPDVNTLTLDRPYGEATGAVTASLFDGFALMPTDFGSFDLIADPYNQRRLAFWITEDQLNILDPTRQSGDTGPRLLASASPSPVAATLGQMRFEYWPRPSAARSYPFTYYKMPAALSDTFVFAGAMAEAGDVLKKGALAQAARWPGTSDKTNPYFNLSLADRLDKEFDYGCQLVSLRDDDQQGSDLARVHWERWPLADLAYNDQALRSTDATIADLY